MLETLRGRGSLDMSTDQRMCEHKRLNVQES